MEEGRLQLGSVPASAPIARGKQAGTPDAGNEKREAGGSDNGSIERDEEDGPRYTDLWIPCDEKSWVKARDLVLVMGLPSAGYVSVELLSHYFIAVVAGTVSASEVVALRIVEGFMWPAQLITMSVLEAVAARTAVYLAAH